MRITKNINGSSHFISTNEIKSEDVGKCLNKHSINIMKSLKKSPAYPKQLAKTLKMPEQNVYYYVKKLERAGLIKVIKEERLSGMIAKYYSPVSDSFYFKISDFKEGSKSEEIESSFLRPFIEKGELNSLIVVGSPDPHGPLKARSRDGYFGMDLALFLGTFLNSVQNSRVKIDTEIQKKDLEENNLIVIGGPIVNKVSEMIGDKSPIYFDELKKGFYSSATGKVYSNDEIGIITKFKSPFNKEKEILFIAGVRNSGTKSAIIAFLKHFHEIEKGNNFVSKIEGKVIEGIDLDSDGLIDEVEFLE
jgi:DNA-binding transcriptional ArsR family regulator